MANEKVKEQVISFNLMELHGLWEAINVHAVDHFQKFVKHTVG